MTYTAQWKINQYKITFDANGGTGGKSVTQDYGTSLTAPKVTRTGYTFTGWQPKVDASVPASNVTYTAQWRINQYKITFNANGGADGKSATQDYGTSLTAPKVTRTGYTFTGWQPKVDATVPASNVTYTAQWKINQYEVVFDANGGVGSVTNEQDYASEIVAPEVSREGYSFIGWMPKVDAIVPASNVTYTAQWRINQYEVTFDANGGVESVTNEQDYASEIVAPEVSREGYTLAGWMPKVDATVPASNVTYTAQWLINQYTVTFDGNGGALGDRALPNVAAKQDYGTEIVAPMATRKWHNFVGWSPKVDATVPAHDVSYTAQWRRWKTSLSNSALVGKTLKMLYPSDYAYFTDVVLEEGVTRLADGFFDGCNEIVRLTLPSTLTALGYDDLPPKIKESLAYDADGFMIYQGWLLGYHNKDATTLMVPDGVVGIGSYALADMYDLETVNLPQSLKYIATGAFREDTYLDNLVIPDGVEIIGESAFEDCSFIQTMTLGSGIKSVGARAFAGCTQLSGAVFADGLRDVGASAFDGCWRMQSVSLPFSTTNVASTAFNGCTALTGVTVPTHGGRMSEWFAPVYSQIRDVTVPEGETDVRASMFEGCGSLRTVQMPDSITNIAARAFYGCSSLPEVRLPEGLLMVGDEAFRNCSSLTAAALPENVTSIGARAFQGCANMSALTLPRGLEALPDYVFADCGRLDSFVVPAAVTNLGSYIVSSGTTAIYYLGNAPSYGANVYGNASGSLKSYVILGTKGWDGRPNSRDIPASWNGRDILTWSANQFDVTFDANGGLFFPVVTNTYACEETTYTGYSLPPFEPVCKGMDFDGYWTEPGGGTRVFTSTRVLLTKPHTLYAHWKKGSTIKVRFNACGGTVSPAEDDYVSERPYCELPVPVREHFAFDGWWTEASGGSRVEISSEVPKAAHELFAHWTPASYTIRFHANNGTDETVDQYFTYGDTVTLRANTFGNSGNIFAGWALSGEGPAVYADGKTLADVAAIQDNVIHLYAVWVDAHYTVRFDSHGGKGRMENQTLTRNTEAALYSCAFTRTGYTFAGWSVSTTGGVVYGDGESVANVYEKTGADVVLYAVWEPIVYSVHYAANGGAGAMSDQQMTYDELAPLASVAFAKSGAWFRGWSTTANGTAGYQDGERVKNLSAVADDVVTLYAVWQDKPAAMVACEDAFGEVGTVSLDGNDNIVVTLTNDVSGMVEIPDNVGAVTIDLNGHVMAGDDGPAIRIVAGDGEGGATQLAIVDASEGEKGQILGGGESAGIEVAEDAATGVKLDVEEGVGVFNGDGSEQELKPKLIGTGKVTVPRTWKVGQKVTWKATADKGSVFARWEGPLVDSLDLAKNERRNPSLAFVVPEGFETNQIKAVFIPMDDDGLYSLGITQTEFDLKETVSGVCVTDDSQSYVTATASGLPSGLKFNAKTLQITGAPTKSGVYWVQVKAKNASGYQLAENVKVTVSGDGKEAKEPKLTRTAYYPLTVICATEGGTATGTGVYADGRKTTIKATPAKGCVFAGWYGKANSEEGIANSAGADYRSPSMSVAVPEMRYVFAKFATKEEDAASLALAVEDAAAEKDGTLELDLGTCVDSLSLPKLSVAGLPSGIKYDAKTMTIKGKATKPGVYTVTVKATNASVTRATDMTTATFKITVPNFECAALPGLKPETDAYGTIHAGVKFGPDLIDCTPEDGWTVKAAGLPAGLKFAAKETKDATYGVVPAWTIYGVPTAKAGAYTVTFTASKKGEKNQVATITLNVEALPAWAVGTFTGAVFDESDAVVGQVQNITVSSTGKISGKIIDGDMTWTLSAPSFDEAASLKSEVGSPAFTATAIARAGKEVATNAVTVAVVDDISVASGGLGTVTAGAEAGPREWTAWRNVWKDAGRKEEAMALKNIKIDPARGGTVTFSAPSASGAVTARLKDGKYSATMSATLIPADSGYTLFWYFPPKAGKFAGEGGCEEVK